MEKYVYIKDENLGGVEREYIKLQREPKLGDPVYIKSLGALDIVQEIERCSWESGGVLIRVLLESNRRVEASDVITVKVTGNIRVNGKRYYVEDTAAKSGDLVLVTKDILPSVTAGMILKVDGSPNNSVFSWVDDDLIEVQYRDYLVLTAIKEGETDNIKLLDIIANLARRVALTEEQLRCLKDEEYDGNVYIKNYYDINRLY